MRVEGANLSEEVLSIKSLGVFRWLNALEESKWAQMTLLDDEDDP